MKNTVFAAAIAASLSIIGNIATTGPASAGAPDNCQIISSVPFTISSSGHYCLTGNLGTSATTGAAISITANNVTLDFQGFRLGGLGAGPDTEAAGVSAIGRRNITVRNGVVRGFAVGIALTNPPVLLTSSPIESASSGHLIENNLIDSSTQGGILVGGVGVTVKNNRVVNTQRDDTAMVPLAVMPQLVGPFRPRGITALNVNDGLIQGNHVSGTFSPNGAYGIEIAQSNGVNVSGNTVNFGSIDNTPVLVGSQNALEDTLAGIAVDNAEGAVTTVRDNTIMFDSDELILAVAPANGFGLATAGIMRAPFSSSLVGCKDNVVGGAGNAFSGCTLSQNNLDFTNFPN